MTRSSAFARVMGLTKSLSPFERGVPGALPEDETSTIPTEIAPLSETTTSAIIPLTVDAAASPIAPAADASAAMPPLVVELPGLAQVTVVPDEAQAIAKLDDARETVTVDAIGAIEADIASLLATMAEVSDARPEAAPTASADDEDDSDPTLALLSELDRMWRADPMVGAANQS